MSRTRKADAAVGALILLGCALLVGAHWLSTLGETLVDFGGPE